MPWMGCAAQSRTGRSYVFPDFSERLARHGLTSAQFADRLLEEFGVAAIDGASFGSRGAGHLRLSFASAQSELDVALQRIAACVDSL
ncbi:MAG: aminotransferase class I/II-fold pyridoxal phosphate-dependent enzyme [Gemmatimonadetes bacterium]|nr:aminotransferase class I/II-fold pyridoxal phosphate-dependent enzyme [Gemmatimonadota bacterium]